MVLTVSPVYSALDFETFINLPWLLYKNYPIWVPPLKAQEKKLLSPVEHPFWQHAKQKLFLARQDGRAVGRIAAIIDEKYNHYAGVQCGAFGFFECINDKEVAHALLDAAKIWLQTAGMSFMRGPLNPSTNYTCGLLVDGFERPPAFMMPWNPPYYPILLETWHLRKEQDLFAYTLERNKISLTPEIQKTITTFKELGHFSCRMADQKHLDQDIHTMLELYRISWSKNWGFAPLSPDEEKQMVEDLKIILDPEFFVLFFYQGKPAAGMVAMPDMNTFFKRLNGKMGLWTLWHWWQSRQERRKGYRIMLFGIREEFRLLGLPILLLDYMLNQARKRPEFQWVEGSWVLEDNKAICDLIEDFSGSLTKRYRIYRREIAP